MRFRFFGTEIYISFLFVAVISFLLATDRTGYCLYVVFAVLLHETGHLIAMWICDCQPKSIKLVPASISITRGFTSKKCGEGIIAVAGPLVNILMFGSLYINYKISAHTLSLEAALINLLVALFNLLPVCGLDGGTILILILNKLLRPSKALFIVKALTLITAIAFGIAGITLIINGNNNISVFILGIYLIMSVFLRQ